MNPWNSIPLGDYESHMSDPSVGQLSILNSLTKKYLNLIKPTTVIFPGIAGGNGLEHIDNSVTNTVIGIDINQSYLDETRKRYQDKIKSLKLFNYDLTQTAKVFEKADMIWAALVLEYTGIDKLLEFSINNLNAGGHLVATIQSNNDQHSVSNTGIESVKKTADIFHTVDPYVLLDQAKSMGFTFIDNQENALPNGKAFLSFHFSLDS